MLAGWNNVADVRGGNDTVFEKRRHSDDRHGGNDLFATSGVGDHFTNAAPGQLLASSFKID